MQEEFSYTIQGTLQRLSKIKYLYLTWLYVFKKTSVLQQTQVSIRVMSLFVCHKKNQHNTHSCLAATDNEAKKDRQPFS